MPSSTRHRARLKLKQAISCLESAIMYIAEVDTLYEPNYSQVSDPLQLCATCLTEAQDFLREVRRSF